MEFSALGSHDLSYPLSYIDPILFSGPQEFTSSYAQLSAESFQQPECIEVDQGAQKRAAYPKAHADVKRARNTEAARRMRQRKRDAVEKLEAEKQELELRNKELCERLNAYIGHYSAHDNNPTSEDWRPLDLGDDLGCLDPGSPLTAKVVNAVMCLLGSVAPFTTVTVDSSVEDITTTFTPEWLQAKGQGIHQIILVPIHIISFDISSGHWLLAVCDSHGTRLLDSLPASDNTRSAKERIDMFRRQFPCWPATEFMEETRCARQETSVDSGVAVLINAIYIVAAALGSEQELPQTLDAALWRQALLLLLKAAIGQTYDLGWADGLVGDTVLLEQGAPNEMQTLWYPGPGPINYHVAIQIVESQSQNLAQQRQRLQKAMEEKIEVKEVASRIHIILSSLLQSATLQKEQVKMLTMERMDCMKSLYLLTELEELSRASSFQKVKTPDTRPQDLEKRLQEVNTCLVYRERMISALNEVHRAWGEVFKIE